MRTNIEIDDRLMQQAMRSSGKRIVASSLLLWETCRANIGSVLDLKRNSRSLASVSFRN
jgi:Arc/MetJ family transcription regulator